MSKTLIKLFGMIRYAYRFYFCHKNGKTEVGSIWVSFVESYLLLRFLINYKAKIILSKFNTACGLYFIDYLSSIATKNQLQ